MDILELVKDGRTQTIFGRHREKLICLEEAVSEAGFGEHRALIIGAGLNFLPYAGLVEGTLVINGLLDRAYSWETLEVAVILERLGKPWTITVVDNSSEVCAALRQQNELIVDDFYALKKPEKTDYAKRFLAALGISANDDTEMEAINEALESKGVGNRLSVFKKAEIPQRIKERIEVVQGSVANLSGRLAGTYNVATCFNVMMHLPSGFMDFAAQSLNRAMTDGSIIASDTAITGFKPIRTFLDKEEIEGDCGGNYTQMRERYLLTKELVLKLAKPEKAVLLPA